MLSFRTLIKNIILLTYPLFRIKSLFESLFCPKVRVIILHDVRDSWLIPMEKFITSMRTDFDFLTPQQFVKYMEGDLKLKRNSLLITFDDGFKSSKVATEKCLAAYNIKALFFVCSDFLNLNDTEGRKFTANKIYEGVMQHEQIGDFQLPMNLQDLKDLMAEGHMIGSHSSNHARLSKISDISTLEYEVITCADKLESMLGTKITAIAWPFGSLESISPEALHVIQKRYKFCFSGIRGSNQPLLNKLNIYRECIDIDKALLFNKLICNNGLSFFYRGQRKVLQDMVNSVTREFP